MLIRKGIIVIILFLFCTPAFSQVAGNVVFSVRANSNILFSISNYNSSNRFLIPVVKEGLESLINQKDTLKGKLFKSVNSFDLYLAANKINDTLKATIDQFKKGVDPLKHSKSENKQYKLVAQQLRDNQYFLEVTASSVNDITTAQFTLYTIRNNTYPTENYIEGLSYRTSSLMVNIRADNYLQQIKTALRQLIYEANEPPAVTILTNNQPVLDSVFINTGTVSFSAIADDLDSPPSNLSYSWFITGFSRSFSRTEKNIIVNFTDVGSYYLICKVSDGIRVTERQLKIIVRNKPLLTVFHPYWIDSFTTGTYYLYSYHSVFQANDFSNILNVSERRFSRVINNADKTSLYWSTIIPELTVWTNVSSSNVKFYLVNTSSISSDSLYSYNATNIPDLTAKYAWQPSDEKNTFNVKINTIKLGSNGENLYSYSLLQNQNKAQSIYLPTSKYIQISAYDHNLRTDEIIELKYRKISRFNPFINLSILRTDFNGDSFFFDMVGIGGNYLLSRGLSINGTIGTSTSKTFSAAVLPFYKIGCDLNLINFYNIIKISGGLSELIKKTYTYYNHYVYDSSYRARVGFGGAIEINFGKSPFVPVSLTYYYNSYPAGYQIGRFVESGARLNVYFAK